jgi:phage terminase small subunit
MINSRQKRFIKYYILTDNGALSARLAGYSIKSSRYCACRLLAVPEINEEIKRKSKNKMKQIKEKKEWH